MADAVFTEVVYPTEGVRIRAIYDDATNRFVRVETENPNNRTVTFTISRLTGGFALTVPIPPGTTSWDIPPASVNRYHALNDCRFDTWIG